MHIGHFSYIAKNQIISNLYCLFMTNAKYRKKVAD